MDGGVQFATPSLRDGDMGAKNSITKEFEEAKFKLLENGQWMDY